MSSYFLKRWPLSYLNLTKKYENIHKAPTAQKKNKKNNNKKQKKHQDIKQKRTTTEVSPWNQYQ